MDLDTILKWGTPIGAAIVFLVGLYQWADARRRDIEQKRFEQFHRAFEWLAGRTATGQPLVDTQQAMAIYELTHFPEYKDISVPILNYYLGRQGLGDRGWTPTLQAGRQGLDTHTSDSKEQTSIKAFALE